MKKIAMALAAGLLFASQAHAQATNEIQQDAQDVKADAGAVHKDNRALAKDQAKLKEQRARKAAAKAAGEHAEQAKQSLAIGGTQTEIGEKKAEKNIDQNILQHHENEMNRDESKMNNATGQ
jgi:hypothetical protein